MAFETLFDLFQGQIDFFAGLFTRLMIAAIVLIVGLVIGRLAGNFTKRLLKEIELNKILKKTAKIEAKIEDTIGQIVSYIIYFFAALMALSQLGIATTVLIVIAIGVVIVIVLAFALGVKDFIPNIIAGIMINKNKLFKEGDVIDVAGVKGKVTHLKLIETEIKSKNDSIFIPNSTIIKSQLKIIKKVKRSS